jgi:hypothetical protein
MDKLAVDFVQKGPKRGQILERLFFLLFFSLIIVKSKNFYASQTDKDKH